MKRSRSLALVLLAVAIVGGPSLETGCRKDAPPAVAKVKRYHCPMHPEVVKDGPGDCPICGMKLVPIEEEARAAEPVGTPGPEELAPITIDPAKEQLLGLKTVAVTRAPFSTAIRTVGRVAYDERRVHHVHTRYEAYVEHVEADFTGKFVKRGEALAQLYSPEVYATQSEYLLALSAARSLSGSSVKSVAQGGEDLLKAARQRLLLWDIAPADIDALEKRGEPARTLSIYAPISGYVTGRTAYHGMKVMPADSLFDIVDLSAVWVLADVYEYELPRLSLGQHATMTLSYWPGRSWTGTVSFIYPALDEKTRTIKVRLDFANPDQALRPEMFAQVVIHGKSRRALVVPDDVVLDSGTRKIVFLAPGGGKLVPREITVGDQADGMDEVREGLAEGDVVARGANFLVDSESRLKAALSAMTAPAKPEPKAGPTVPPPPAPKADATPAPPAHAH